METFEVEIFSRWAEALAQGRCCRWKRVCFFLWARRSCESLADLTCPCWLIRSRPLEAILGGWVWQHHLQQDRRNERCSPRLLCVEAKRFLVGPSLEVFQISQTQPGPGSPEWPWERWLWPVQTLLLLGLRWFLEVTAWSALPLLLL